LGRDLAQQTGVPANYLSKILLVLNRAGLVEATRGTGGGYRLARPAAEISLQEIVDPVDNLARLEDCIMGLNECSDGDPCAMHEWWKQVRDGYLQMLRQTSLADVKATQLPGTAKETEDDR
jgi:Rrf2 family protein